MQKCRGKKEEEKKKEEKGGAVDDVTDGSIVNYCKGKAQEERKEGGGTVPRGRLVHDGRTNVRTDLPTTSDSYILQRLAQPTPINVLREQRPGTRRPSGLVKTLHNDNVVLTQVRSYRCSATTATPVTTSTLDEDVDGVRDVGKERPRFFP